MSSSQKKRSKSSRRWLDEHFSDPYVLAAQKQGYRSRAVYKLITLQEKDRILKPKQVVVDLGAAPGGWSQYASELVGHEGLVIALDILPIDPLAGVDVILGDFTDNGVYQALLERLHGRLVNVILSDLAPNMTGIQEVDQPRSIYLTELALAFAEQVLVRGGTFVTKCFQGEGFNHFLSSMRRAFKQVIIRKPPASRPRSREVYLIGKEFLARIEEKC